MGLNVLRTHAEFPPCCRMRLNVLRSHAEFPQVFVWGLMSSEVMLNFLHFVVSGLMPSEVMLNFLRVSNPTRQPTADLLWHSRAVSKGPKPATSSVCERLVQFENVSLTAKDTQYVHDTVQAEKRAEYLHGQIFIETVFCLLCLASLHDTSLFFFLFFFFFSETQSPQTLIWNENIKFCLKIKFWKWECWT